ncbi:diheme cytochrome c [Polynucleobacter sinensis]|jgi:nitrate/TMAO reductase-like tetraheme cytochrome c subunit|uniref:diheme cytochrome c n=1 Tax=Polynucleobacter sinensis TaxID=1743157 RepID=UPI000B09373A|nr:diheme cytochrome c [Polynucleobacter sinensis]
MMKKYNFVLLTCLLSISGAFAAKMPMPADAPASYEAECASCHMAYPPGLLSEKSWQNVMSGLDKHFGTDASVDAKTRTEMTSWLVKNAATRQKYSETAPENRITKTSWFIRKHDEVKADVWKRASIKSPANCGACHIDAAKGVFSESNIKIPSK